MCHLPRPSPFPSLPLVPLLTVSSDMETFARFFQCPKVGEGGRGDGRQASKRNEVLGSLIFNSLGYSLTLVKYLPNLLLPFYWNVPRLT